MTVRRRTWNEWLEDWKKWGIGNPHLVAVPVLSVLGLAAMIYQWWITPDLIFKAHTAMEWTPDEALERAGTYGDMFGVTNALFSGVAMVAAISAIILQIYEFSAQRQELELANNTHQDRLRFDKRVHDYARGAKLSELIEEYHTNEDTRDGLSVLELWIARRETLTQIAHDTYSDEGREFIRQSANKINKSQAERDAEGRVRSARNVEVTMRFFDKLNMLQPNENELKIIEPLLKQYHGILRSYSEAVLTIDSPQPPLWPTSVIALCDSYLEHIRTSKKTTADG